MKKQQGFIVPLLILIIVLLVIGGGYYIYNQDSKLNQNSKLSSLNATSTDAQIVSQPNQNSTYSISDQTILDAENVNRGSGLGKVNASKFISDGKGAYTSTIYGGGSDGFSIVTKGDINSDGYQDALVSRFYCGASCGNGLNIIINIISSL